MPAPGGRRQGLMDAETLLPRNSAHGVPGRMAGSRQAFFLPTDSEFQRGSSVMTCGCHAPPRFRVLVPLSDMPAFLDAFGVAKSDAMFRALRRIAPRCGDMTDNGEKRGSLSAQTEPRVRPYQPRPGATPVRSPSVGKGTDPPRSMQAPWPASRSRRR